MGPMCEAVAVDKLFFSCVFHDDSIILHYLKILLSIFRYRTLYSEKKHSDCTHMPMISKVFQKIRDDWSFARQPK